MQKFRILSQKPLGQVLLATLLFCFVFLALFVGLYKTGIAYIGKEHARRSTNLTALTGGAVYANGLQLVRESNGILAFLVGIDLLRDGTAAALAVEGGPPAMVEAALTADKVNLRTSFQGFQNVSLGVDTPGIYPLLIEGQAVATASENQLNSLPAYAYNYETATVADVGIPNMALRFRTAAELLPETKEKQYSLAHNGVRHYFSSEEVESAHNPRYPKQMRVKKDSGSEFAGWWVRKEKNGTDEGDTGELSTLGPQDFINSLRDFLKQFKFDVTDRDDPPCHTFALFSAMNAKLGESDKNFYQAGEVRVDSFGLAAWDIAFPINVYMEKVDLGSFPVIRDALQKLNNLPVIDQLLKTSDILNGL